MATSRSFVMQTICVWILFHHYTSCVCVCVCVCVRSHTQSLSRIPVFVIPCTVAHQAPLSMGVPRQEHLPFPFLGDFPDPGIESTSLVSSALAGDSLPLCHLRSHCTSWVTSHYANSPEEFLKWKKKKRWWLRLQGPNAGDTGLTPSQGTNITHATYHSLKKE